MNILLTKEVAALLRISEDHCRCLIREGKIKAYKEGKRGGFRILAEDVDRYIKDKLKERA